MAIAFRSVGTTLKVDTSVTAGPYSVSLPSGHTTGDLLLMFVTTDDNNNTSADPSGWTRLFYITNGSSVASPYTPRMRTKLYYRIDNGSLGSSVSLTFNTSAWPTGKPSVLAFTVAYTGCDTTGPIERWDFVSTTSTATAQAHPQETITTSNAWLLTFRTVSTDTPAATFTNSVVGDSERKDDSDTIPELACALYDSNAALTSGLQTQRTTTASRAATYGGIAASIVIKPASTTSAVFASAGTASISMVANSANATGTNGPWDLCSAGGLPTYSVAVDWGGDGSFADLGDDVTNDVISDLSITYGRDQNRQLNPAAAGSTTLSLINVSRKYSPEYASSVLFGNLEPARPMHAQVTWAGVTYPLFTGRIDDFDINADFDNRSVSFTFLDALNDLSRINLSTPVYQTMRTGDIIDAILDQVGWTAGRQLDLGATIVKYWWADQTDALTAITDLVKSEGAPAIAFVAPDGTFVFHDRHHRIQNSASVSSQAEFAEPALGDCTAPDDLGEFHFTPPFAYAHGWRDIVNSVTFDVTERQVDEDLSVVWSTEDTITLGAGETTVVTISANDPFINAVTPVEDTDFTATGAGTPVISMSRDSGLSVQISILASGGAVSINNLQLQAQAIPVKRNLQIHREDSGSISKHGERTYPDGAPWANANDAYAIAGAILLRYAERRPTVDLRVVTQDPSHFMQIVMRTIGDRIHIRNDEMGIDDDFFVERVTHDIQRMNQPGHAPVHSIVFGCEKATVQSSNPFRFDVRGAGFDQGIFDPINSDSPFTTFQFDHPITGLFDFGVYGT